MKTMKKVLALVLTLSLVLTLGLTAFAAEGEEGPSETPPTPTGTITFPSNDKHQYKIFQVFTGEMDGEKLQSVKWGEDCKDSYIEGDYVDPSILDTLVYADVDGIEDALASYYDASKATPYARYDGSTAEEHSVSLPVGYYVVEDIGLNGDNSTKSTFIVKVVGEGSVDILPKRIGTPVAEKKVEDKADSEGDTWQIPANNGDSPWQDSADHDIGDDVPFQIEITVPAGIEQYNPYKMIVCDTPSEGLTFNDDVEVYLKRGSAGEVKLTAGWSVEKTMSGDPQRVSSFTVTFSDVNTFAQEGDTIYVRYHAKLNEEAVIGSDGNPNTMYLKYSNNPNGEGFGETQPDKVIVFTYKTVVNKVDNVGNPLVGAGFTLYKWVEIRNDWVKVKAIAAKAEGDTWDGVTFEFTGLDDGKYKLVETTWPEGYNKAEDIEFYITATHDYKADAPTLLTFSGDKASGNADINNATDSVTAEGTGATNKVVNNKGVQLPSTGGIGTTLFYVVGSILMLAAVVLLISRKKMSAYQD